MTRHLRARAITPLLFAAMIPALAFGSGGPEKPAQVTLLNVSYDPTRELYQELDAAFAAYWKDKTGITVTVQQSHAGSGKQARSVIDGLQADVVTLSLAWDVDQIAAAGLMPKDWQKLLPDNAAPYTSTMIFLVRAGNPKGIRDWDDLARTGVSVITPNPKTSGGARWNYLAAWGYALRKNNGDQGQAREFVRRILTNVPVLDTGARGSTTTFSNGIGDALITWENEAILTVKELGVDKYQLVVPSVSILAEPTVGVVEAVAKQRGTLVVARAYLEYLYTAEGQTLAAKHYYRPRMPSVLDAYRGQFPPVTTFTLAEVFGSWDLVQRIHFDDGGTFDQIMVEIARAGR